MHLSLLNFIARYAFLILHKKNRRRKGAISPHCKIKLSDAVETTQEDQSFHSLESSDTIPEFEECWHEFITMYPDFQSTNQIDLLRSNEYSHLNNFDSKVCLDYCGIGLFSYLQGFVLSDSSSFTLSEITSNLTNLALHGNAIKGTAENDIKNRIMDFLNATENDYSLVFTDGRGSAFQLLAESYPFEINKKLITMLDHESQSVNWMVQRAREKGAKVYSAEFKWPTLKVCTSEMMDLLSRKKRRKSDSATGLFLFPVQSRVSGVQYAYKWMALAKQYGWHVLLDAGSVSPNAMESLGLSLYRPDFIITSFYRVFGWDSTGFGCLLIKKSVMKCLQNRSGDEGSHMVRIVAFSPQNLGEDCLIVDGEDELNGIEESVVADTRQRSEMPAYSGPHASAQVRNSNENEIDLNGEIEETDSAGEMMKSPILSVHESSDNSLWVYLGQSPTCSENSDQLKNGKLYSHFRNSSHFGEKKHKSLPPMVQLSNNPLSDHAFDSSFSEDVNRVKKDPKEKLHCSVIQGEIDKVHHNKFHDNDLTSTKYEAIIEDVNENAIEKKSEFKFTLLDKRDGSPNELNVDMNPATSLRPSKSLLHYLISAEASWQKSVDDSKEDDLDSEDNHEYKDDQQFSRKEPKIICRHIDHITKIGLNKTVWRPRYLVNWLVASLMRLREGKTPLIRIYGPRIKNKRGVAVAFNVRDSRNGGLIHPETVQKLADRNGIRLGLGFLSNVRIEDSDNAVEMNDSSLCKIFSRNGKDAIAGFEVVIASLGFLTNFADVYKMWAFVARFLDPSFVGGDGLADIVEMSE